VLESSAGCTIRDPNDGRDEVLTNEEGVFANDGMRESYTGILKIEDSQGQMLYEYAPRESQVIDPEIARKISDVLSDNEARTPAFGPQSYLHFDGHQVAVKTGTTNDYRDAWIVGYTPSIAIGAWAGNNDNSPMEKKVAGFIVAPMWNAFFTEAFKTLPESERFPEPQAISKVLKPALRGLWYGGETYAVDKLSGKLATQFTPNDMLEERVIPNPHDILYWINREDPMGPRPTNPYDDAQFLLWEVPAQRWISANGLPQGAWNNVPGGFDDLHNPDLAPKITVITPVATTTYARGEKLVIQTAITSSFSITRVDFFVNGSFLGSTQSLPYDFAFLPTDMQNISSTNELHIAAYDSVGNKSEITVPLLLGN
jgi:membrane carboxypeptidase/penicillin-binding protein PbpC